jgi:hypothetical protein
MSLPGTWDWDERRGREIRYYGAGYWGSVWATELTGTTWRFIKVPQVEFEKLHPSGCFDHDMIFRWELKYRNVLLEDGRACTAKTAKLEVTEAARIEAGAVPVFARHCRVKSKLDWCHRKGLLPEESVAELQKAIAFHERAIEKARRGPRRKSAVEEVQEL